jgi:mono/diheme cytochrome c family protein
MLVSAMRAIAIAGLLALTVGCANGRMAESEGEALFVQHCASCHGVFGEGDGPVASVMQVAVPNLRTLRERAGGTFPRDAVMRYIDGRDLPAAHGDRLMPVWGDTFAAASDDPQTGEAIARERIAAITDFVERLQY